MLKNYRFYENQYLQKKWSIHKLRWKSSIRNLLNGTGDNNKKNIDCNKCGRTNCNSCEPVYCLMEHFLTP